MQISLLIPHYRNNDEYLRAQLAQLDEVVKNTIVRITPVIFGVQDQPSCITGRAQYLKIPNQQKGLSLHHVGVAAAYAQVGNPDAIAYLPPEYSLNKTYLENVYGIFKNNPNPSLGVLPRDVDIFLDDVSKIIVDIKSMSTLHLSSLIFYRSGYKHLNLLSLLPPEWWGFEAAILLNKVKSDGDVIGKGSGVSIIAKELNVFEKDLTPFAINALQVALGWNKDELVTSEKKIGIKRDILIGGVGFGATRSIERQNHEVTLKARQVRANKNIFDSIQYLTEELKKQANLDAANLLISFLIETGKLPEAFEWVKRYIYQHPYDPGLHMNIGNIFVNRLQYDKAIRAYKARLNLGDEASGLYTNLAMAYQGALQFDEAVRWYKNALRIEPENMQSIVQKIHCSQHLCDWTNWDNQLKSLVQHVNEGKFSTASPFTLLSLPVGSDVELKAAKQFGKKFEKLPEQQFFPLRKIAKKNKGEKIRVGYFSSDFFDHATLRLMIDLFESHNHEKFEWFAYSFCVDDKSELRKRMMKAIPNFRDCYNLDEATACKLICDDQLDILVDLKGYTRDARLDIIAKRPAPIIMEYLGYPGSTGMESIDYVIADHVLIPPKLGKFYSEKVVRLPHSYQPNDSRRPFKVGVTRASERLPNDAFVFASFNQPYKITPYIFKAWMDILKQVPNSVLWLYVTNNKTTNYLLMEATKLGIDKARIIFAGRKKPLEHLERVGLADLILDTHPYNAHTTASDALWMGVPVITYCGDTFASRVAASLLSAVNLEELIAYNIDDYTKGAIRLANDPKKLQEIKLHLVEQRQSSPLWDAKELASNIEKSYVKAYENACQGVVKDINL